MSGIAEVLLASGFSVTGSDLHRSAIIEKLESLGAEIFIGHQAEHVSSPAVVVTSTAVPLNNPEVMRAHEEQIPVIPRAEMLAELMRLKRGVAVAGSHGKTTTTSLLGQLLRSLDPTVVVGGRVQNWNASSLVGRGNLFVIEADESDKSFLKFSPVYSIVTNVDREHLDNYADDSEIDRVFLEFLNRTAFFGKNWICGDCPRLTKIRSRVRKPVSTYGMGEGNDLRVVDLRFEKSHSFFSLESNQGRWGEFELPVVGEHNVLNAAGALALALELKVGETSLKRRIKEFVPADRRMQIHFQSESFAVCEDYAHHPTEIKAALRSADLMFPGFRKLLVFQPHRYSRTESLWSEFIETLRGQDELHLLPIYAAHEKERAGVSSEAMAEAIEGPVHLHEQPEAESIFSKLDLSQPSVVLVLGASPLTQLATDFARLYSSRLDSALRLS